MHTAPQSQGEMSTQPQPSISPSNPGNLDVAMTDNNNRELSPTVPAQTTSLSLTGPSLTSLQQATALSGNEEKGNNPEVPHIAPAQSTSLSSTDNKPQPPTATSRDDGFRVLLCLIEGDSNVVQVKAPSNGNVLDLKKLIHLEKDKGILCDVNSSDLILWKLKVPITIRPSRSLAERIKERGEVSNFAEELDEPTDKVLAVFMRQPSEDGLHLIVKLPATDERPTKRLRLDSNTARRWTVSGSIREMDHSGCYYLDPGLQPASEACLRAVQRCQFVLLSGARASGKTTRLLWLQRELTNKGYIALYLSFQRLYYMGTVPQFWESIGRAINRDVAGLPVASGWAPAAPIVSQESFLDAFGAGEWQRGIVLLIDELSELKLACREVRDSFLRGLREARNHAAVYAIKSTIGAGTFGILRLNPSDPSISPFNISDRIDNPYFTIGETRKLFQEFAQDVKIVIEDAVIVDIWAKSGGHPAMVSLCGRIISDNLLLLLKRSSILSYQSWQQFPTSKLYDEIAAYNTFRSMRESLLGHSDQAVAALRLLRCYFAGYLDNVQLLPEQEDSADFLAAEGVLLRPVIQQRSYKMASPLLDGYIRTVILPCKFSRTPSIPPPFEDISKLRVLDALIESLKYFDKNTIRLAVSRSDKRSNVHVRGRSNNVVPRESVYDTELMGILSNWIQTIHGWTVTGQWHLRDPSGKHKYTNIVIQKEDDPAIVLELLATGNGPFFRSHVEKTSEYMRLLSANEAWVIHFTCEDGFRPIWQSDTELAKGVNVVHFWHDLGFKDVMMSARYTDATGNVAKIVDQSLPV